MEEDNCLFCDNKTVYGICKDCWESGYVKEHTFCSVCQEYRAGYFEMDDWRKMCMVCVFYEDLTDLTLLYQVLPNAD